MRISVNDHIRPDGSSDREILVSESPDRAHFDRIAGVLEQGLEGSWIERLDGPDERYWDLAARGGVLTLHLQHFVGITIFVPKNRRDDAASRKLLEEAASLLAEYDPAG
jgi:hypothetical protein